LQAVNIKADERAIPNPDSAVVWHFTSSDVNRNGKIDYEEEMHRAMSTPAIQDDILYIPDFSGVVHCLNAKTGEGYWNFDMFSQCWGSALIVVDKVYVGNEVGEMLVFRHSSNPAVAMPNGEPLASMDMGNSVFMTAVVANGVLFVATKDHLFAIAPEEADDGQ
jgi:outer membrane protein assembly factor BamB